MKIYLFNPETGIYLGEDFADETAMEPEGYILPPDATTIAPPEIERGQVLVFNGQAQCWTSNSAAVLLESRFHGRLKQNRSSENSV
jgi:hypothetical protein